MRRAVWFAVVVMGLSVMTHAAAPAYVQTVEAARRQEAKELVAMGSWLSLVALQPLDRGDVTVGSATGNHLQLEHGAAHAVTLHMTGDAVSVSAVGAPVMLGGKAVRVGQVIAKDGTLAWDGLTATVIKRTGNRTFLRVADPKSANLKAFHGLKFYPVDAKYRFVANWVPYSPVHTVRMGTVTGDVLELTAPGYVEFAVGGTMVRLEPYPNTETGGLSFLFRDGTAMSTTYGAGRELDAGLPSHGLKAAGTLVVDFNLATNPPCAYTGFATCPLAPKENRFSTRISAGELRYHE